MRPEVAFAALVLGGVTFAFAYATQRMPLTEEQLARRDQDWEHTKRVVEYCVSKGGSISINPSGEAKWCHMPDSSDLSRGTG